MNRRISRKHAKWLRPPRLRGPLAADEAADALPRILQRLRSRNEVWVVVTDDRHDDVARLLSAQYYIAVSKSDETRGAKIRETGVDRGS